MIQSQNLNLQSALYHLEVGQSRVGEELLGLSDPQSHRLDQPDGEQGTVEIGDMFLSNKLLWRINSCVKDRDIELCAHPRPSCVGFKLAVQWYMSCIF